MEKPHSHHMNHSQEMSHDHSANDHSEAHHSGMHHDHHAMMVKDFQTRFWVSLVLTIPVLVFSPMIQAFLGLSNQIRFTGDTFVVFFFSSLIYFYGGWPFLKGLWEEVGNKQPGMMTLIGVAITAAYVYSSSVVFGVQGNVFFWELATLIDIMLFGHWVEMKSVIGAGKALEQLVSLIPDMAHKVEDDGSLKDVSTHSLKKGDLCLVKPGEKVPRDGVVIKGITSMNESMLTGESKPISKHVGDIVIGGAINGEGSITLEVQKTEEEAFIFGVIKLVREAQASKSKTQDIANRAAEWLTIIALSGGALTFSIWMFATTFGLSFAMERAVTVMVITCPHALGLAVPLVVAVSTSIAATHGLLIRNRTAFEQARNIQAIIFDKTGTLTKGEFGVTDVVIFDQKYSETDVINLAGSIEKYSEHPIAKGIVKGAKQLWEAENFQAIFGKGAEGDVQGKAIKVVSPGYLKEAKINVNDRTIEKLKGQGKTVVFVLIDGVLAGALALADIVRPESKRAVSLLKEMGIRCMMLTGDNQQVAKWVADQIGLDEYFAEVLPDQKAAKIKEVQSRGLIVAMTGDGINDAPALAQADVGIAIGAGTDVAIETADIILVKSNPMDVVSIVGLARSTYRKMIENLLWATGYNVFAIPAAAGAFYAWGIVLTPALGAVFMSLSTVICAVNSKFLRLKE
ncbi:MAG: copper-translocating P-type ATPase [Alphaproteobacteria bacterium]|nr:copper-translocating P-type ATPase [Alphaproteobacteria bacterium]